MAKREVQIGEYGKRVGESHQRAIFSDKEIEDMRDAYDARETSGESVQQIADRFGCSKRYVFYVCGFERRNARAEKVVTEEAVNIILPAKG